MFEFISILSNIKFSDFSNGKFLFCLFAIFQLEEELAGGGGGLNKSILNNGEPRELHLSSLSLSKLRLPTRVLFAKWHCNCTEILHPPMDCAEVSLCIFLYAIVK